MIVGNAGQDIAAPKAQVEGNNPVDSGIQAEGKNINGVDAIEAGKFGQRLKETIQDSENRAAQAKRVFENLYEKYNNLYENNVRGGDGGRRGFYDNSDGRTSSTRDAS